MTDILIFGAGGLGRLVHDIVVQRGGLRVVAFLDTDVAKRGQRIDGVTVLGGLEMARPLRAKRVERAIVAIGEGRTRVGLAQQLQERGFALASAIHPGASIAASAEIGEHVILGARALICVHARIGAHTVVSASAIVEHDNRLGQGVFLQPAVRLAGGVTVEDFATLQIGACVIPGRRVGVGARVEAGAVVIHDVPPGATVSGAPARPVRWSASRFVADSMPLASPASPHSVPEATPAPA